MVTVTHIFEYTLSQLCYKGAILKCVNFPLIQTKIENEQNKIFFANYKTDGYFNTGYYNFAVHL